MGMRILIVDDALFMRNMIKEILKVEGFEIAGEASNGIEAVEKYKDLKPDAVTMDIVMPGKNGIEALKEIKEIDKNAKVIMVSALGQESLVMEALEAGAVDFITKPFKKEKVIQVLKKVLQK